MKSRATMLAAIAAAAFAMAAPTADADEVVSYLGAPSATGTSPVSTDAIGTWTTSVTPVAASGTKSHTARAANVANIPGPKINGPGHNLRGLASYYASGELTANGERFDKHGMTAAHKTLPFGTKVRVTRLDTGSSIVVRINDRGPFKPGRVIDLSEGAADNLGITAAGLAKVSLKVLPK